MGNLGHIIFHTQVLPASGLTGKFVTIPHEIQGQVDKI